MNKAMNQSSESSTVAALIIGDIHYKKDKILEGQEFNRRILGIVEKNDLDFIVILGDTLHCHNTVDVEAHNTACRLIEELSKITEVYLLIGNHDYINNQQFLTDKHIFGPLKKWKNVYVIDEPLYKEYNDLSFVFCPYVPAGRFTEALDKLITKGNMWDLADYIFAHQEFRGCEMGAIVSVNGDDWDENYPPVISGHIHDAQVVGKNVFYPGSPYQHSFGSSPGKKVWLTNFGTPDYPYFSTERIDIGMKGKKTIYTDISNINKFNTKLCERYHIKLVIRGTSEQFKVFRKGEEYLNLRNMGVIFSYDHISKETELSAGEKLSRYETSYLEMLKRVVLTKSPAVKDMYETLVEDNKENTTVIYDLVFEED
ncbi:MAG: metallophosphoesterase [Flavobacteriaceae bacterium]|nr:metallophosphoesterase [Flavobacteriaceae bacterium]